MSLCSEDSVCSLAQDVQGSGKGYVECLFAVQLASKDYVCVRERQGTEFRRKLEERDMYGVQQE